jgi:large subunit ribosomal protein L4
MELKFSPVGSAVGSVQAADEIFGVDYNEALIHQIIVAQMAGERAGTKAQKTRAEVSGGGIKPWKQKGTGRARAGTIRSPLWRKGGVTFAAKPRNFSQKVNKKMYRGAMRSILSELYRQGRLLIVENFELSTHKTKELLTKLLPFETHNLLIITEALDENLYLASRNIPHLNVFDAVDIDSVTLLAHEKVIITVPAIKQLEERLA